MNMRSEGDIALVMLFIITLVGMATGLSVGWVQADAVVSGDGDKLDDSDYVYGRQGVMGEAVARQMNGTIWFFYVHEDGVADKSIMGKWTEDEGTTWQGPITITDDSDPGYEAAGFPNNVYDVCVLSNNSIIIFSRIYAYNTTDEYEFYLWCHWNNSDLSQWEPIIVYSHPDYDAYTGTVCTNDDDDIMAVYEVQGNELHHDILDTSARTWDRDHETSLNVNYMGPWALCNQSNEWIVAYSYNPGTFDTIYFRKESDWTLIHSQAAATQYEWMDAAITTDDTFVYTYMYDGAPIGGWTRFYYWNSTGNGFVQLSTTDASIAYPRIGITPNNSTYVFGYSQDDDEFIVFNRPYHSGAAAWQGSRVALWTETGDYLDYTASAPKGLYPQFVNHTGHTNYTQLPASYHFHMQELDGDGTYDYWALFSNSPTWDGIPGWTYTPPAGPGPSGNGDDDDDWLGTWDIDWLLDLWIFFVVLAMFVGIMTTARKVSDRARGWKYAQRRWATTRQPLYSGYRRRRRPPPRPKFRRYQY